MTLSETNRNEAFYSQIDKFGLRKKTVYKIIKKYGYLTDYEIAEKMRLPINSITGRRKELLEAFYVKAIGSRLNEKTNKLNTIWVTTTPEEREQLINSKRSEYESELEILYSDLAWLCVSKITQNLMNDRIHRLNELIKKL